MLPNRPQKEKASCPLVPPVICAEYIEKKNELEKWSEVALNDILLDVVFKACPLVGRWLEIDNHEDLAAAEKLFAD
jgi:NDP-sugar pyrophosphorylase family protein